MAEMEDIISRLSLIFNESSLKYVLVGGITVIYYGYLRSTQDIDIIIEKDPTKISQFKDLLKRYDFDVMENQFTLAFQEGTNVSIFDKRSLLRLDINFANRKSERDVLKNAIERNILGKRMFIAPLEFVLIGKLLYLGNIDKIPTKELLEYQDVIDFLTIYNTNKEKINITFLKKKVKELGLINSFKKLVKIKI